MKHAPMYRSALVAAILLRLAAPVLAVQAPEDEVMGLTQAACDAFRTRDVAALEEFLAPEFTLVSSNSEVQTRAQTLAEVRSGDPKYEVFRNHGMTARVYKDAAVVQGVTSLKGQSGGKPFALDVRFTDTLVKEKGKWRLVVSHVTRIPTKNAQ